MEPVQPPKHNFGWKHGLIIFGGALLLMLIWNYVSSPMLVSVTGTGKVSATASSATIGFSVSASDATAEGAVTAAKTRADSIKGILVSSGVPAENITQSQITLVPAGLVVAGTTGFQTSISMSAKTIHVAEIEKLMSTLYTNGVYLVSQPVLSVDNEASLQAQAMQAAIKNAKSQIGKIALGNLKLVRKIASISEYSSTSTATATTGVDALTQAKNPDAVVSGVFDIVKVVTVVYQLW
jgi:uncharacterized protein YggE